MKLALAEGHPNMADVYLVLNATTLKTQLGTVYPRFGRSKHDTDAPSYPDSNALIRDEPHPMPIGSTVGAPPAGVVWINPEYVVRVARAIGISDGTHGIEMDQWVYLANANQGAYRVRSLNDSDSPAFGIIMPMRERC